MKNLFLILIFSGIVHTGFSQYWMRSGGSPTIDEGLAIYTGPADETVVTGYFTNTAVFDAFSIQSNGVNDIFVIKTDVSGIIQWVKQAGGSNVDKGLDVAVDAGGNVLVTGFFNATAIFDAQTIVTAGQQDMFIAKYNNAGNLLWVNSAGGTGTDIGNSVKVDHSGNVIVTGEFSGTCNFGPLTLTSQAGSIDVFIAKYAPNGNLLWVKKGSGPYTDRGINLALDTNDNIYVNGLYGDTITFDVPHYTTINNGMFLVKLNPAGQEQWFRWLGGTGQLVSGGMDSQNNLLTLAGSFTGSLFFYGNSPTQQLPGPSIYNIYICRYDDAGNLLWKEANGSINNLTAEDLTVQLNGDIAVAGNFECRLTDFSAVYGSGTFCSMGFSDAFVSGYNSSGIWQWARNFGSKQNDLVYSITSNSYNRMGTCGSFDTKLYATYKPGNIIGYNTVNTNNASIYCNDSNYFRLLYIQGNANSSDIFINCNIDLSRQPLDYFDRAGTGCSRPFGDISICPLSGPCLDTLTGCNVLDVNVDIAMNSAAPDFIYNWSNGLTTDIAHIYLSGYNVVTVTSADGCFSFTDSVYAIVNNAPPIPLISDNKGVNFFSQVTLPVNFCIPDSVVLFSPNSGANTVQWTGFPSGQNPVTVHNPGIYVCVFTDSNGCMAANSVQVIAAVGFSNIAPQLICLEDSDHNDTIVICQGAFFNMFPYDTLSNPTYQLNCIPGLTYVNWFNTVNFSNDTASSNCSSPYGILATTLNTPGNYTYFFSAWVVRKNLCDTDSVIITKPLYVIVNPSPTGGNLNVTISGPQEICVGDTVYLVASGGTNYLWGNGTTNDTLMVTIPGFYTVSSTTVVTNGFGCSATSSGFANFFLNTVPQPVISTSPPNVLLCPGDSVQLVCSGTTGTFQWQGPNGSLPGITNAVYVSTPGYYYCIQTLSPTCQLVSNTLLISQSVTPSYAVLPAPTFCKGDSAEIVIYADSGVAILWYSPLAGIDLHQVVYSPGTYNCEIYTCNTLYQFAINVYEDSAIAEITPSDSSLLFCEGDSIRLHANIGMASYQWLPSGDTTLFLDVAAGGNYQLITTSANGCHDSAYIQLNEQLNNLPAPQAIDTAVCVGDSIALTASGQSPVYWTNTPVYNNIISQGYLFQTPPLFNPVTYFLFTDSGKCKSPFDSVQILIAPAALAQITASDSSLVFCEGDSITLTANPGMYTYLWLPGQEQSTVITVDTTRNITLISQTIYGCSDTAVLSVTEQENNLVPPAASDTVICEGESIILHATGSQTVFWSDAPDYASVIQSGAGYQTPSLFKTVTYYLFIDSGACKSAFDSVLVSIEPCNELPDTLEPVIPNIFTPNGDLLNDFFPEFNNAAIVRLQVYNRWGEEVFISSYEKKGWNGDNRAGQPLPSGTYFFLLNYKNNLNQEHFVKGELLLLR